MKIPHLVVAAAVVGVSAVALRHRSASDPVPVRDLLARPAEFDGRVVTARTAGFQPGDAARIHYRRFADEPPALVAVFAPPFPATMPQLIRGRFHVGSPHVLEDCEAVTASP